MLLIYLKYIPLKPLTKAVGKPSYQSEGEPFRFFAFYLIIRIARKLTSCFISKSPSGSVKRRVLILCFFVL